MSEKIKVRDIVTVRSVPMNDEGCDDLRLLRQDYESSLSETLGKKVVLPYPTVISYALSELRCLKGIAPKEEQDA